MFISLHHNVTGVEWLLYFPFFSDRTGQLQHCNDWVCSIRCTGDENSCLWWTATINVGLCYSSISGKSLHHILSSGLLCVEQTVQRGIYSHDDRIVCTKEDRMIQFYSYSYSFFNFHFLYILLNFTFAFFVVLHYFSNKFNINHVNPSD